MYKVVISLEIKKTIHVTYYTLLMIFLLFSVNLKKKLQKNYNFLNRLSLYLKPFEKYS